MLSTVVKFFCNMILCEYKKWRINIITNFKKREIRIINIYIIRRKIMEKDIDIYNKKEECNIKAKIFFNGEYSIKTNRNEKNKLKLYCTVTASF